MTKQSLTIVFLLTLLASIAFAHETDSVFVPPKPEKPLRFCSSVKKWIEFATTDSNMVEITHLKGLRMDLRYGTFNNVTGHDLYCGVQRAFIHKDALPKLKRAIKIMEREMPGSELVIFDASRPLYAQEALRACFLQTAAGIRLGRELQFGDAKFDAAFPAMIRPSNIEQMNEALNEAMYAIERNANAKITFMQLSFKMSRFMKK